MFISSLGVDGLAGYSTTSITESKNNFRNIKNIYNTLNQVFSRFIQLKIHFIYFTIFPEMWLILCKLVKKDFFLWSYFQVKFKHLVVLKILLTAEYADGYTIPLDVTWRKRSNSQISRTCWMNKVHKHYLLWNFSTFNMLVLYESLVED